LALSRRGGQGASEIEKYFRIRLRTGGTEEICFAGINIIETFLLLQSIKEMSIKREQEIVRIFRTTC
jgi:hypothetical protein